MSVAHILDLIALIFVAVGLLICVARRENVRPGLATALIESAIALAVVAITVGGLFS